MSRAKKKRIRAMQRKIARRRLSRYRFNPEPLLVLLPGLPGSAKFSFKFSGTIIEGKITLP